MKPAFKDSKKKYCFPTDELHKFMDLPDLLKINAMAEQEVDTFVHNYFINNLHITFKSASMKKRETIIIYYRSSVMIQILLL